MAYRERRKPHAVPVWVAGSAAGVDANHVADLVERTASTDQPGAEAENWSDRSLASLINHIVRKHHACCRDERLRLQPFISKSGFEAWRAPSSARPRSGDLHVTARRTAHAPDERRVDAISLHHWSGEVCNTQIYSSSGAFRNSSKSGAPDGIGARRRRKVGQGNS